MSTPNPTNLDFPQVLRSAFDETTGRLRTDAQATVVNADINVNLDAAGGDNVAIKDSNGDELNINPDGSINVAITGSQGINKNIFNEQLAVASGSTINLVTYNVPVGKTAILDRIFVSGENIATYEVYINSTKIDIGRTYFGNSLNMSFNYSSNTGLKLVTFDNITVKVINSRPSAANFSGRIQIIEI